MSGRSPLLAWLLENADSGQLAGQREGRRYCLAAHQQTRESHTFEDAQYGLVSLHLPWNETASFVFAVINYSPDEIMDLTLKLQSEGKDN